MAHPMFIHIMKTGDIYASIDVTYVPSGTVAATFKVNTSASTQKLGTITGAGSPNYTCSGDCVNRHSGKENT